MSRERFAQIIVATIIVLGTNAAVAIFVPGQWAGFPFTVPALVAIMAIFGVFLKKVFAQFLIAMGLGVLGAALIIWLALFFMRSQYENVWQLLGLGSGYLLAGLVMKAWER